MRTAYQLSVLAALVGTAIPALGQFGLPVGDADEAFSSLLWPGEEDLPSFTCFDPSTPPTQEQMARANSLMRGVGVGEYNTSASWSGIPNTPAMVTWSLVPDGTPIAGRCSNGVCEPTEGSRLFQVMDSKFGGQREIWINYIQSIFDRWATLTGLHFVRVSNGGATWDDGAPLPGSDSSSTRGMIRISCKTIDGPNNVLGYAYYPGTGDIVLDAAESWENNAGGFLRFRNVLSHELGHAIGLAHSCPRDNTKLMEPTLNTNFDGPQHDDIRGAHAMYGDAYESNNTPATAFVQFETQRNTTQTFFNYPYTGNVPGATTAAITNAGDVDYYRSSVVLETPVAFTVTPRGVAYDASSQNADGSCNGGNITNSLTQARLALQVLGANGTTVLAQGAASAAGGAFTVGPVRIPAGNYFIRISAPDGGNFQPQGYTVTRTAGAPDPPANDACANAIYVPMGTTLGTTLGANRDGESWCDTQGIQLGDDVWYRFNSGCASRVQIDTCGSEVDMLVSLHRDTCPGNSSNQIGICGDNSNQGGAPCPFTLQGFLEQPVTPNTIYRVRVASRQQGAFRLNIRAVGAPANDRPEGAIPILPGMTQNFNNCAADRSAFPSCSAFGLDSAGRDVWYTLTPNCTGGITLSTCGTPFNTVLSVYTGVPANLEEVVCVDNGGCGGELFTSSLGLGVAAGTTYYIRVGGVNDAVGNGVLVASALIPNAPSGLEASREAACNRITFSWAPVPGALAYRVYRSPTANFQTAQDLGAFGFTTYNDPVGSGSTMHYWVRTITHCGESAPAGPVQGSTASFVSFVTQPQDTTVRVGQTATFTAYAVAGDPITYRWNIFRNGLGWLPMGDGPTLDGSVITGSGTNTLVISNVQPNDATFYGLAANTAGCGQTVSNIVTLTVNRPCVADFDDGSGTGTPDGGVTVDDLLYYLILFEQGLIASDIDDGSGTNTRDGGVTIDDLLYYFLRYAGGC